MKLKSMIFSTTATFVLLAVISAGLIFHYIVESRDYKTVFSKNETDSIPAYQPFDIGNTTYASDGSNSQDTEINTQSLQTENLFPNTNTVNLLFLGLDRTEDRDKTIGVYRTDSIVLASIDLDTKKVNVISIPRDSYVYIEKIKKKDKIGHAYVWSGEGEKGIQGTIDTIQRFGKYVTVDYYFCIDMQPVPDIVDRIGGVDIDVEVDMKTHGYNLDKGFQHLDGQKSLQYIRWRYSGAGDIDRIKRQQKFTKTVLNMLKDTHQMVNTVSVVMNYRKYIKTNMDLKHMIALASLFENIPDGNTRYYTIPGYDQTIDEIWYWVPNEAESESIFRKVYLGSL